MPNFLTATMKLGADKKGKILTSSRGAMGMLFGILWGGFSLFFVSLAIADPVVVQVRAKAQVDGNNIYLKDVAEITAPPELKEKMGAISLGVSPRPGKEKEIAARRLITMVQSAKVMPVDVKMKVPESIRIERAFQSISEETLQQLYERSIRGELDGADVKVHPVKVSGTNQFPKGTLTLSVSKCAKQELMGIVNLRVQVQVNGESCGRLTLSGGVDRFMPVVCVSREVKHHAVLVEQDLTLKNVNISTLSGELITDITSAVGKQTIMSLKPGTCLRSGLLTLPPLVKKGDRVKILASSGKLSVSTMGIAKGSGRRGEQIQVENTVSNKTVVGRVTGEATVEVIF